MTGLIVATPEQNVGRNLAQTHSLSSINVLSLSSRGTGKKQNILKPPLWGAKSLWSDKKTGGRKKQRRDVIFFTSVSVSSADYRPPLPPA